jgi:predicted O-methyltransferase YrrM
MFLGAWLNHITPDGPCFDPSVNPIPGSPVPLCLIDALAKSRAVGKHTVRVLEIGSFVGTSALAWGNALKEVGVPDWRIYCADAWHHFDDVRHSANGTLIVNNPAAFNHEIFKHNVQKLLGFGNVVEVIADSEKSLDGLRDGYFDFVYVDGFHGYTVATSDIRHALRLCAPDGVICGDDYDCGPDAQRGCDDWEADQMIVDGVGVHPGLSRAVDELLGAPQPFATFWAFERDGLKPIDVAKLERAIPSFIPPAWLPQFQAALSGASWDGSSLLLRKSLRLVP